MAHCWNHYEHSENGKLFSIFYLCRQIGTFREYWQDGAPHIIPITSLPPPPALSKPRLTNALYWGWPSTWTSWTGWQALCLPKWSVLEHLLSHQALLFPFFLSCLPYPNKLLALLLAHAHPHLLAARSDAPQPVHSHICLMGRCQGEPPPTCIFIPSLLLPPPSQHRACAIRLFPFVLH